MSHERYTKSTMCTNHELVSLYTSVHELQVRVNLSSAIIHSTSVSSDICKYSSNKQKEKFNCDTKELSSVKFRQFIRDKYMD